MAPSTAPSTTSLLQRTAQCFSSEQSDALRATLAAAEGVYAREGEAGLGRFERACSVAEKILTLHPDASCILAAIIQGLPPHEQSAFLVTHPVSNKSLPRLLRNLNLVERVRPSLSTQDIERRRTILVAIAEDIRVFLLTACHRWEDLERARLLPPPAARLLAKDVLETYAPLASRLGIYILKNTMESLAFPLLYPAESNDIAAQVSAIHGERQQFLNHCLRRLQDACGETGLHVEITGREKLPYSVFRKMREKVMTSVGRIHDLFAFRIVVDKPEECYLVLGAIHKHFRPLLHRFKDYISFPKPNGYRSLHTTVLDVDPQAKHISVEVQIRTDDMHREAEYGIAAHWDYKEGAFHSPATRQQWREQLRDLHRALAEEGGDESALHLDILSDRIYALTPRGDVVELPAGSTPLDFAFRIHTDIGLYFRAARVNGNLVPIEQELENGDVVEILTQREAHPSPQWLQIARTSEARTKLRSHLSAQHRDVHLAEGRRLINEALHERGAAPLDAELTLLKLYGGRTLTPAEREDILIRIGRGAERASSVLRHVGLTLRRTKDPSRLPSTTQDPPLLFPQGLSLPYRFALCCKPQMQKRGLLRGLVTRSGCITLHLPSCYVLRSVNVDRLLPVHWQENPGSI